MLIYLLELIQGKIPKGFIRRCQSRKLQFVLCEPCPELFDSILLVRHCIILMALDKSLYTQSIAFSSVTAVRCHYPISPRPPASYRNSAACKTPASAALDSRSAPYDCDNPARQEACGPESGSPSRPTDSARPGLACAQSCPAGAGTDSADTPRSRFHPHHRVARTAPRPQIR